MASITETAKLVMTQFLNEVGIAAEFKTAAGGRTIVRCDFREQMSGESRDRRGGRSNVRHAVAHIHKGEIALPTIEDTLEVASEVWKIEEVNPESTSHRLDLRISTRLERTGGRLTEGRI